jgi:hypothetical protein
MPKLNSPMRTLQKRNLSCYQLILKKMAKHYSRLAFDYQPIYSYLYQVLPFVISFLMMFTQFTLRSHI